MNKTVNIVLVVLVMFALSLAIGFVTEATSNESVGKKYLLSIAAYFPIMVVFYLIRKDIMPRAFSVDFFVMLGVCFSLYIPSRIYASKIVGYFGIMPKYHEDRFFDDIVTFAIILVVLSVLLPIFSVKKSENK